MRFRSMSRLFYIIVYILYLVLRILLYKSLLMIPLAGMKVLQAADIFINFILFFRRLLM